MFSYVRALAAGALLLGAARAGAQPAADPFAGAETLTLDALVQATLQRNTSLAAAEAALEAAAARPRMEGAWMDPMVMVEAAPLSVGQAPFGFAVRASQRVPFPGKLGLRSDAADAEAKAAGQDVEEVRLGLRELGQVLYADWYEVARALGVNAHHHELMVEMKRSAEAQYGAGMASQQDPLQAQRMLAELELEKVMLQSRRSRVAAQLNGLLHRDPAAPLPPPPSTFEPDLSVPEPQALQQAASERRPMLAAMDARLEAAQARTALAQKAWLPDFELSAGYSTMWAHPEHRLMLGVGVEVPVQWGMRRAQLTEAEAMAKELRLMRERAAYEVATEVEQARQMLQEAVSLLGVHREKVLPAARAQLEAARAGFITGRNEFEALVEAETALRHAQLQVYATLADVVRRRAMLERMIGDGR